MALSARVALRVDGLGKQYRIGAVATPPSSLREAMMRSVSASWRRLRPRGPSVERSNSHDLVWALRDVTFEVREGEVLGVIGRNGAGKSTLLKVLSRIVEPTVGSADVYGRVGSLLEVGTGFHPELTGRDNVFLNGAILGMDRRYIASRFDEIVEFSGIGRYIDTPVKRYSSGMYLRLAFAVAAHLEPDVLIVDEVLAVGDADFQRKCLGRMDDVARDGRTVMFVSHNMNAIQRLCRRSILMADGRLVADGDTHAVVASYLASASPEALPDSWIDLSAASRAGSGAARCVEMKLRNPDPATGPWPATSEPLEVTLLVESDVPRPAVSMAIAISDRFGTKLVNADSDMIGVPIALPEGRSEWRFTIDALYLMPGTYVLGSWLAENPGEVLDQVRSAYHFEVADRQELRAGVRVDRRYGGVVPCTFLVQRAEVAPAERMAAPVAGAQSSSCGSRHP
jgi:lipopolysaccharide transport system ATP-binding protein